MSRKIFDRYRQEHYADAPDGQPHDDNHVPYEHLQEYSGKRVFYNYADRAIGVNGGGHGTLEIRPAVLTVSGDSLYFHISSDAIGVIRWDEATKSYEMFDGKLTIKPL